MDNEHYKNRFWRGAAAIAISGVVVPVFLLTLVSSYPIFLCLAIAFGFLTGSQPNPPFLPNRFHAVRGIQLDRLVAVVFLSLNCFECNEGEYKTLNKL